jgi:Tfp pilus assembly ATPase PilU
MPDSFCEFACQPGWTVVNCRTGAESAEIRSALLERFTGSGMLHLVCLNGSGSISGSQPTGQGLVVQRTHGRDFGDWRQAILCAARSGPDVLLCSGLHSRATLDFALTVSEHVSRVVFSVNSPATQTYCVTF